jgi:hypothetical protein
MLQATMPVQARQVEKALHPMEVSAQTEGMKSVFLNACRLALGPDCEAKRRLIQRLFSQLTSDDQKEMALTGEDQTVFAFIRPLDSVGPLEPCMASGVYPAIEGLDDDES